MDEQRKMDEQLVIILKEMCKVAGVDYDEVDFKKEDWWREHTWTAEQEEQFRLWLIGHLKKSSKSRKAMMSNPVDSPGQLKRFTDIFMLSYGWRTEEK